MTTKTPIPQTVHTALVNAEAALLDALMDAEFYTSASRETVKATRQQVERLLKAVEVLPDLVLQNAQSNYDLIQTVAIWLADDENLDVILPNVRARLGVQIVKNQGL